MRILSKQASKRRHLRIVVNPGHGAHHKGGHKGGSICGHYSDQPKPSLDLRVDDGLHVISRLAGRRM